MRSLGRPPLWGVLIPLYPSFTTSLWRDTSEILAALLVLSGLVALRCEQPIVATTVVVPVVLGMSLLWARWCDRPRPAFTCWQSPAPIACFVAWQAFLRARWERARARLDDAGVAYQHQSGASIYFRDPDGARLELIADPLGKMYGSSVG